MRTEIARTGHRLWLDRLGRTEVRFVGRGPGDRAAAAAAAGTPPELSWVRQIHSARVLEATAGCCGEGDALVTRQPNLALSVVSADCVPILLAGDGKIASIHAGWRGIAADIVGATLARLDSPTDRLTSWLGPAIGPCCYEVGEDVAAQVAEASDPETVHPGHGRRPHLDLQAAVTTQLHRSGLEHVHRVPDCTRCSSNTLWSYRRDGPRAGRNLAFVWLRG